MKRILSFFIFRIIQLAGIILIVGWVEEIHIIQTYVYYTIAGLILFFLIVLRRGYTANHGEKGKLKLLLSLLIFYFSDIMIFIVFYRSRLHVISAIITSKLIVYISESFYYSKYFFSNSRITKHMGLFPLPLLKELYWVFMKIIRTFVSIFPA